MHRAARNMIDRSVDGADLSGSTPEAFIQTLIDVIPSLADEFTNIDVQIAGDSVPTLCATLRRGMLERIVENGIAEGHDEASLRAGIDPSTFELPRRIETYAMFHQSVALRLPAKTARLLAEDLARGSD